MQFGTYLYTIVYIIYIQCAMHTFMYMLDGAGHMYYNTMLLSSYRQVYLLHILHLIFICICYMYVIWSILCIHCLGANILVLFSIFGLAVVVWHIVPCKAMQWKLSCLFSKISSWSIQIWSSGGGSGDCCGQRVRFNKNIYTTETRTLPSLRMYYIYINA